MGEGGSTRGKPLLREERGPGRVSGVRRLWRDRGAGLVWLVPDFFGKSVRKFFPGKIF